MSESVSVSTAEEIEGVVRSKAGSITISYNDDGKPYAVNFPHHNIPMLLASMLGLPSPETEQDVRDGAITPARVIAFDAGENTMGLAFQVGEGCYLPFVMSADDVDGVQRELDKLKAMAQGRRSQ